MIDNERRRVERRGNPLLRGAVLGVVAVSLAVFLLLGAKLISIALGGRQLRAADDESVMAGLVKAGILGFEVLIPPAVVGGVIVAWILRRFSHEGSISYRTGILVGALPGIVIGTVIPLSALSMPEALWAIPPPLAIGMLVGAWHGWQMAKWLNNRQLES